MYFDVIIVILNMWVEGAISSSSWSYYMEFPTGTFCLLTGFLLLTTYFYSRKAQG